MTDFGRRFEIKSSDVSSFGDLLSLWRPSGASSDRDGLRLAIRDNYLNFYCQGQSIAKIKHDRRGKLQATVHRKYIDKKYPNQAYKTFPLENCNEAELKKWITNSERKPGEKAFVDLLVTHNPNVIDLEAALPSGSNAPRMDLVVLEKIDNIWTLVFWEAKLVSNEDARCECPELPKVCTQIETYRNWMKGNRETVINSYRSVCELLQQFHSMASEINPSIELLGKGISEVAIGAALDLDCNPRLIIDNRTPDRAFEQKGHLAKLRNEGIYVQMVNESAPETFALKPSA